MAERSRMEADLSHKGAGPLAAFLVAEAASFVGNKMTMLALPWLVLTTTGSATKVGVVAFAQTGCYVLVKALGSPIIDRLGRKACAVGGGFAAAGLLVVVPGLSHLEGLPLPGLVMIVAMLGAVQSMSDAAKRLMVPDLAAASGRPLERITSLYAGVERSSFLIGTPAAGLMIAAAGAVNVLLFDAVACVLAATLIAVAVPVQASLGTRHGENEGYVAALKAGLRYVSRDRLLVAIAALMLITNLIDQAMMAVFIPTWVKDVLNDPTLLGTIIGSYGLGAVLGSLMFAWVGPKLPRYWTFSICLLLAGSSPLFALALSRNLLVVLAVTFGVGIASASINPILSSAMFERVPEDMQARVFGFTGSLAWAGIPLGGLVAGLLVDQAGRTTAMLVSAVVYLGATLSPFVLPGVWKQLERKITIGQGVTGDGG